MTYGVFDFVSSVYAVGDEPVLGAEGPKPKVDGALPTHYMYLAEISLRQCIAVLARDELGAERNRLCRERRLGRPPRERLVGGRAEVAETALISCQGDQVLADGLLELAHPAVVTVAAHAAGDERVESEFAAIYLPRINPEG